MRPRVYVAGKLTAKHPILYLKNLTKLIRACINLIRLGYAPFPTGLDLLWFVNLEEDETITEAEIKEASIAWVTVADAVLVLDNWKDSPGTKKEMDVAKKAGVPVIMSIEELLRECPPDKQAKQKGYKSVKLGTQVWMEKNLNINVSGSWTHPDDPTGKKYGRYYTWDAAMKAVPKGWHLPSDEEWQKLIDYLGEDPGKKLRKGKFRALLSGYRYGNGAFYGMGSLALFWSSSQYDATYAWYRHVYSSNTTVYRDLNFNKTYGFCARCVKD